MRRGGLAACLSPYGAYTHPRPERYQLVKNVYTLVAITPIALNYRLLQPITCYYAYYRITLNYIITVHYSQIETGTLALILYGLKRVPKQRKRMIFDLEDGAQ